MSDQRRCTGKEPDRDDRVEDHTPLGRGPHEWPNRIAPQMVRQVPCRMHQPRDSNEPVGSQPGIDDRRR